MATKTFEELKQMAIQIRDEKANKQNTATRIGTQMLEHLNKFEQEYYNKDNIDKQFKGVDTQFDNLETDRIKKTTELNISVLYPTNGVGGTNRYELAGAIAQVEEKYRSIQGLKVTFVNNETSMVETWVYNGETFTDVLQWELSNDSKKINNAIDNINTKLGEITLSQGGLSASTGGDLSTNYNERIKTSFIPQFKSIVLNEGFILKNYCEYDKNGGYIKGGILNNTSQYSIESVSENLYRFTISKNDSSTILPSENAIASIVYYGKYLEEEITNINEHFAKVDDSFKEKQDKNIYTYESIDFVIEDGFFRNDTQEVVITTGKSKHTTINVSNYKYVKCKLTNYINPVGYIIYGADSNVLDTFHSTEVQDVEVTMPTGAETMIISWDSTVVEQNIQVNSGEVLLVDIINKHTEEIEELKKGNNIETYHRVLFPFIYSSADTENEESTTSLTTETLYQKYESILFGNEDIYRRNDDIGTNSIGNVIRCYTISMRKYYVSPGSGNYNPSVGENAWDESTMGMRRILLTSGVHGDERDAAYSLFLLVKDIVESNDDWAKYVKANYIIDIIPCINPYGLDNNTRNNNNGVDLNRDFKSLTPQDETKAVIQFIQKSKNLIGVIDMHNTSASAPYLVTDRNNARNNYYARMAMQISNMMLSEWKSLFISDLYPYFFLLPADQTGHLHWFAEQEGLLSGTFETPKGKKYYKISKETAMNALMYFAE